MHADDLATLRSQAIEQVMRLTGQETLVVPWLQAGPCSPQARVALGRLLAAAPFPLHAGAPVAVWAGTGTGRTVDPHWRSAAPARPGSLWAELVALEAARPHPCPTPCACPPLRRLHDARDAAAGRGLPRPG